MPPRPTTSMTSYFPIFFGIGAAMLSRRERYASGGKAAKFATILHFRPRRIKGNRFPGGSSRDADLLCYEARLPATWSWEQGIRGYDVGNGGVSGCGAAAFARRFLTLVLSVDFAQKTTEPKNQSQADKIPRPTRALMSR